MKRKETWAEAAKGLHDKGFIDNGYGPIWSVCDQVHRAAFRAGQTKGIFIGAGAVIAVLLLGWVAS